MKFNEYRQKISAIESELKEQNHSGSKLSQINSILENRVSHLEYDRNNKTKEIELFKERYENLKIQKSLLFSQQPLTDSNLDSIQFKPVRYS